MSLRWRLRCSLAPCCLGSSHGYGGRSIDLSICELRWNFLLYNVALVGVFPFVSGSIVLVVPDFEFRYFDEVRYLTPKSVLALFYLPDVVAYVVQRTG
ncbi:hypothetical protein U1Q18_024873 [Sarracenia purpurea var. burkii]